MPATHKPELIILGQVTVDDVVPAAPGAWTRQMGGSSLYAVAGARLWLEPSRIGVVARLGQDYPFDVDALLRAAGLRHIALPSFQGEHLIEWLIYEPDGSRRSLPRNPELLDIGAEGSLSQQGPPGRQAYFQKLLDIAPAAELVPPAWLPTSAVHLCPQVGSRHRDSLIALREAVRWISVDPSAQYGRSAGVVELAQLLQGATAFLPSVQEVRSLLMHAEAAAVTLALQRAGFAEVVLKRGGQPVLVASAGAVSEVPIVATRIVDPTGAGDAFCGAYAACRLIGHNPLEAARRAAATAALVVGCSGVAASLQLQSPRI